ncbi:MAG: HD domain-containing protein [Syntrophorhabdaceae bacterium]|nr:HD domain-containing protein [Syntrophorhabdaceae bacterium]
MARNEDSRYMSIPPGAIVSGSLPKFKIYIKSYNNHYTLWALDGNVVTQEKLNKLAEIGHEEVFIDLEEEIKYEEYLENHLTEIVKNNAITNDHKVNIISRVSTNIVKNSFESTVATGFVKEDIVERIKKLVENALIYINHYNSLPALSKLMGHDYQTYEHATKVFWLTIAFLCKNPDVIEEIQKEAAHDKFDNIIEQCGIAAMLHDIGKAYIPKDILNKKGALDEIEWEKIQKHPLNGVAMLIDSKIPTFVKKAVLHHHENYDGTGYPFNLEKNNISCLARIMRIIDVFDAMTSNRPYKKALTPKEVVKIMVTQPNKDGDKNNGMRNCFDQDLLRKFIILLGKIKITKK